MERHQREEYDRDWEDEVFANLEAVSRRNSSRIGPAIAPHANGTPPTEAEVRDALRAFPELDDDVCCPRLA